MSYDKSLYYSYISFQLTHRQAVDELFSNITWTFGQADDLNEEEIISHWKHPDTNIYINLVIFIIMNVSSCLSIYLYLLPDALMGIIGRDVLCTLWTAG